MADEDMMLKKIQKDLKQAQISRNGIEVSTLRLLLSEIHNGQIQKGEELSDEEIVQVISREVKKRKEASLAFRQGGREEQAQKEEEESKVLEGYLPSQLTDEALTKIVSDTITEVGATTISDMGKVMSTVMGKVAGRADGGVVSTIVKEKLLHR